MTVVLVILALLIIVFIVSLVRIRNSIIGLRNHCEEAWGNIDAQLTRRHDLVPNLVETVKGYASHETEAFEKVAVARADAMTARGTRQSARSEQQLTAALADLRAVTENYPELRATENFRQLSSNLSEVERQIQVSRDAYNAGVQAYNTKIQIFPNSIVAKMGNFEPKNFFEVEDLSDLEPVEVNLGD
ncbi:MAG: LemA family protein [Gemmatimonadetes bacterium]|nr:LemA family protein [Gemmatimonadota bacterium]